MKRISSLILFSLSLFMGCRTADSTAFVNPLKLLSKSPPETTDEEEIRENSLRFVENAKKRAAGQSEEASLSIQQGQQQIVSWYQDQDDRHIAAAKKHFRNSLQIQPSKNVDAHHGLAVVADLEENFIEAERQYQLALAQSPSDSKLLGNLGYSYLLQDRLVESERYLLRATQVDSKNNDAIKHLGDVYVSQGRLGEAQETYSRIMRPEEARQLITNHTPPATQNEDSLIGKLIPGRNPEESTALEDEIDELRRLQAEQNRAVSSNLSQSENTYRRGPRQNQFGPSPEQLLKQNLAAIDQERFRNSNGHPIIINPEPVENQRFIAGAQQPALRPNSTPQHFARQNQPATMSVGFAPHPSQGLPGVQHPQRTHLSDNGFPQIQPMSPNNRGAYQPQTSGSYMVQQNSHVDPLQKPWTGLQTGSRNQPLNQVGHLESVTRPRDQGVQNLRYESSPIPNAPSSLQQPGYPGSSINSSPQHIQNGSFAPQQHAPRSNQHQNAFENASMEAARLGMGLGPGTMFSTVNQTAPRQQPGANSNWNGNSFPQPNRMLPTNLPPQDLQQMYRQPAVNSLGQQISGSQVSNNTSQFGTASRFDAQQQQSGNLQSDPQQQYQMQQKSQQLEMEQRLAEQRIQANQQLNTSMQEAWNQRRMNLHSPSPNTPALLSPAEHGGMVPIPTPPNRENLPVESYPNNQSQSSGAPRFLDQNRPANGQFKGQYGQGQNGQRQNGHQETNYRRTPPNQYIVEPAPYHTTNQQVRQHDSNYSGGVIQSSYSQQPNQQSPRPAGNQSGYGAQSNSGLPMIVPGSASQ